jgi:hypothetical protein
LIRLTGNQAKERIDDQFRRHSSGRQK